MIIVLIFFDQNIAILIFFKINIFCRTNLTWFIWLENQEKKYTPITPPYWQQTNPFGRTWFIAWSVFVLFQSMAVVLKVIITDWTERTQISINYKAHVFLRKGWQMFEKRCTCKPSYRRWNYRGIDQTGAGFRWRYRSPRAKTGCWYPFSDKPEALE